MDHYYNKNLKGKYCELPFNTAAIHLERGDTEYLLYTCWCAGWTGTPIGNIEYTSLEQAWKSPSARKIRESVLDGDYYYCSMHGCGNIHNLPDSPKHIKITTRLPTQLTIRIDESCNLSCPMCRNEVYSDKANYERNKNILLKIIKEYKDFDQRVLVMLDASGEVLASKAYREVLFGDQFPRCFEYQLMSNGVLLKKFRHLIENIKNNIDSMSVSVDATTADVFSKTRRGGNWQDLLDGLALLRELQITFFMQFVIQKDNQHQILDFYNFAKAQGAERVIYSSIERFDHMDDNYYEENCLVNLLKNKNTADQLKAVFELQKKDEYLDTYGPVNQFKDIQLIPSISVDK